MDRRKLIKLGVGATGLSIIAPQIVLGAGVPAEKLNLLKGPMAGNLFYTKDAPGRWSEKVRSHLPIIEKDGDKVKITNKHASIDHVHYIVKHAIFDENFQFLDEVMFEPEKEKYAKETASQFVLKKPQSVLFVLSYCNQHDGWMDVIG